MAGSATFLLFMIVLIPVLIHCTKRVHVQERMADMLAERKVSGRIQRHLMGRREVEPEGSLLDLSEGESLESEDRILTSHGTMETKYMETYEGLPVIGESVVIETDFDGDYTGTVYGYLVDEIKDDVPSIMPSITQDEAYSIALENQGVPEEIVEFNPTSDIKLAILIEKDGDEGVEAILVYRVSFLVKLSPIPRNPLYTINANTGEIIRVSDKIEAIFVGRPHIETKDFTGHFGYKVRKSPSEQYKKLKLERDLTDEYDKSINGAESKGKYLSDGSLWNERDSTIDEQENDKFKDILQEINLNEILKKKKVPTATLR